MATMEPAFGWLYQGFCPGTFRASKMGSEAGFGGWGGGRKWGWRVKNGKWEVEREGSGQWEVGYHFCHRSKAVWVNPVHPKSGWGLQVTLKLVINPWAPLRKKHWLPWEACQSPRQTALTLSGEHTKPGRPKHRVLVPPRGADLGVWRRNWVRPHKRLKKRHAWKFTLKSALHAFQKDRLFGANILFLRVFRL